MSSADVESLVDCWAERGLKTYREAAGEPVEWLEVCVSMEYAEQPTLPCSWISYDDETGGAYLKGHRSRRACRSDEKQRLRSCTQRRVPNVVHRASVKREALRWRFAIAQ